MKIFVSHAADTTRYAVRFKELITQCSKDVTIFLSSDWESIPSGSIWLQEIEEALSECDLFIVLIVQAADAARLWINYEVGFARGRKVLPKIIVFSGIAPAVFEYPLRGIHLLFHGDTNRWLREFAQAGIRVSPDLQVKFAELFEKRL